MKKYTDADIEEMRRLRFEEKLTLQQIGDKYKFSRERVRQLIGNTGRWFKKDKRIRKFLRPLKSDNLLLQFRITEKNFYSKLQRDEMSGCWVWVGAGNNGGYTRFRLPGNRWVSARMFSHYLRFGDFLNGKQLRYKCGNHKCCNPDHERNKQNVY